jgi:lipopolysaccharide/colanic/teichoic acid biosynthesis glycosyltransferase
MASVAFKDERAQPARRAALLAYRLLDVLLALPALLVCLPLLLALCLLVRIDSEGPAIFRQRRLGRDRRPFTVHKFRTMRVQCDESVHREYVRQLIDGSESTHSDGEGRDLYKLAADDRVTRVGRMLRRSSLDELPQIFDVLRGHMSLVGPRPVIPYEAELYPPEYELRFAVKPGITGLWQINGRNERSYREMVDLDVRWASGHSLGLYLSILLRTPVVILRRRGVA